MKIYRFKLNSSLDCLFTAVVIGSIQGLIFSGCKSSIDRVPDNSAYQLEELRGAHSLLPGETGIKYSYTQTIKFLYQLNLGEDNHLSNKLIMTIKRADQDLRICNISQLKIAPGIKGEIRVPIIIKNRKAKTHSLNLARMPELYRPIASCLMQKIERLNFPVLEAQKVLKGSLNYQFASWIQINGKQGLSSEVTLTPSFGGLGAIEAQRPDHSR